MGGGGGGVVVLGILFSFNVILIILGLKKFHELFFCMFGIVYPHGVTLL